MNQVFRAFIASLLAIVCFGAHAVERPQPNSMGFVADSDAANKRGQVPILFPGDTLVAGWTGRSAISSPNPSTSINCATGGNGLEGGEYVIRTSSGLSEINASTPSSNIINVCPGDYSDGATIDPQAAGTAWTTGNFYMVRCLSSDRTENPYNLVTNPSPSSTNGFITNHNVSEECIFPQMNANDNPQYWLWQGITWLDEQWNQGLQLVRLEGGADNFIFDRNWFDCKYSVPNASGTNYDCMKALSGSDYITVQNSILGPCAPVYDADMNGYGFHESSDFGTITRSEVFNCQKAVFSGSNVTNGSGEGLWIIDNDLYIDERLWILTSAYGRSAWEATGLVRASQASSITQRIIDPDGAQSSLFSTTEGKYSCAAQTTISTKHGSNSATNPIIIKMNRLWGKRGSDSQCLADTTGSGMSGSGQHNPENAVWESNIFFDMANGIRWPFTNIANANLDNIKALGNVFVLADIDTSALQDVDRWLLNVVPTCSSPCSEPIPRDFTFKYNSFAAVSIANGFRTDSLNIGSYSGLTGEISCNVAHGGDFAADAPSGVSGFGNVSIDGADWDTQTGVTATKSMTSAQASEQTFCFDGKQVSGPEQICTSVVMQPTDVSDYVGSEAPAGCNPAADGITHDPLGNVRSTLAAGAFEPAGAGAGATTYRYNVGGPQYTDTSSNVWTACNTAGSSGPCPPFISYGLPAGDIFSTSSPIAGTADDEIFQTIAAATGDAGQTMDGSFSVTSGSYNLNLYFNEIVGGYTVGSRLIDVIVEGSLVQSNFDIVAEAGGINTALIKTYSLNIADGAVDFQLINTGIENPILSGVEILPSTPGPDPETRPLPNQNGFTSPNQTPVLFDNDTLVGGWTGDNSINSPEPLGGAISCTGASGLVAGEYIIRDVAGVAELSASSLVSNSFWVCPGIFNTASSVALQASGSAGAPVRVRCLSSDRTSDPFGLASNPMPSSANGYVTQRSLGVECVLPELLNTSSQQHWFFQGITFAHSDYSLGLPLINMGTGGNIVFDRVWFDCSRSTPAATGAEHSCIYFGDPFNTARVQQSVVGPCAPIYDSVMRGVWIAENASNVHLVRSEVLNCSTAVYVGDVATTSNTGTGIVIEDNDLHKDVRTRIATAAYVDSAWTATGLQDRGTATSISQRIFDADGAQAALFDQSGIYGCGGAPQILVAHGDATASNLIRLNRIWGNRSASAACQTITAEPGDAIELGNASRNSLLESNFIFDNTGGIHVLPSSIAGANWDNVIFRGNYLDLAFIDTSAQGETNRSLIDVDANCLFLCTGTPLRDFTFEFNDFGQLPANSSIVATPFLIEDRAGLTASVSCNNARGSQFQSSAGSGASGFGNTEINGASWAGVPNITSTLSLSTTQAAEVQRCVWRKLLTDPEFYCTSTVSIPTTDSQYFGANAQPGC